MASGGECVYTRVECFKYEGRTETAFLLKNGKYDFENKQAPMFLGLERIGRTGIYKTQAP